MNIRNEWIKHLKENNMTYYEHFLFAFYYGIIAIFAGVLLIIHSLLPCFFQTTGSYLVTKLSRRFKKRAQIDDT